MCNNYYAHTPGRIFLRNRSRLELRKALRTGISYTHVHGCSIGRQQDAAEFLTRIMGGINDLFTCQRLRSQVDSWSDVLCIIQ